MKISDEVREVNFEIVMPQRNPEDGVLDEIDRLVTDSMYDGMRRDWYDTGLPVCPVCEMEWHGMRGDGTVIGGRWGCPGEYGTSAEKHRWKRDFASRVVALKSTGNDKV